MFRLKISKQSVMSGRISFYIERKIYLTMNNKMVIGLLFLSIAVVVLTVCMWIFISPTTEKQQPFERLTVEGTVMEVSEYGTYENNTVYNITLDDGNTYQMFFRIENAVVPPTEVELRFYYDIIVYDGTTIFDVYKIKSL